MPRVAPLFLFLAAVAVHCAKADGKEGLPHRPVVVGAILGTLVGLFVLYGLSRFVYWYMKTPSDRNFEAERRSRELLDRELAEMRVNSIRSQTQRRPTLDPLPPYPVPPPDYQRPSGKHEEEDDDDDSDTENVPLTSSPTAYRSVKPRDLEEGLDPTDEEASGGVRQPLLASPSDDPFQNPAPLENPFRSSEPVEDPFTTTKRNSRPLPKPPA